ncbi:MAG: hypothetical protein RI993_1985 [Pseudomonadota bacterium]|jgi:hypothetical protein
MSEESKYALAFYGARAEQHELDLYDAAQSLLAFQRTLALTTHLVLHNQIITQAPSLKNAAIFALPPEEGSWTLRVNLMLLTTGAYYITTVPPGTPLGHLVQSVYDYAIHETLGFHVDYDKSLGQQYEELTEQGAKVPFLKESRINSLIEKCEPSFRELHRPIYAKRTAENAVITSEVDGLMQPLGPRLNLDTFEYVASSRREDAAVMISGSISSYNSNTFTGRVFVLEAGHPVPFELMKDARTRLNVRIITSSLSASAQREEGEVRVGKIYFRAFRITSRSGRLKRYLITDVSDAPLDV